MKVTELTDRALRGVGAGDVSWKSDEEAHRNKKERERGPHFPHYLIYIYNPSWLLVTENIRRAKTHREKIQEHGPYFLYNCFVLRNTNIILSS